MQGEQGVGTAASGGKGGQSGGPQMWGGQPSPLGDYTQMPAMESGGGGKGGNTDNSKYLPDESGGVMTTPAPPQSQPPADLASQGATAFDQGLAAMNGGMDWMQGAMGHQAPQLGGDYNVSQINGSNYLDQMGKAGGGGYSAAMMSAPDKGLYDYNPAMAQGQSYQSAQLSDKDIADYMNPYTQSVIDSSMNDLDKARQQAMNSTGAAATQGGAFGGDRHAIMESQNNSDYMDQVARTSSQLRNQGYQNAQQAAMGDVNSVNQQRGMTAQMAQQANMANQAAANDRSQFVGATANSNAMQTGLANQSATNAASALGAQLGSQASIANANSKNAMLGQLMGYENANNQFNAGMDFSRDQFNAGQDQQQFMNQMAGAQNLYGMGNDRWNMGQEQVDKMAGVGNQVDQINQGYINSVQQMFQNQQNAPQAQYQQMLAAMSGMPNFGGTQSYNPGFFDYASLGAGVAGSWLGGGGKS